MDNALAFTSTALTLIILVGMIRAQMITARPWLAVMLTEAMLQSIPLYALILTVGRGSPAYYSLYYQFSGVAIVLNLATMVESWRTVFISVPTGLYVAVRISAIILLLTRYKSLAKVLEGEIRPLHIVTYFIWAVAIWWYRKSGLKPKMR
jgi:hypothetical protein